MVKNYVQCTLIWLPESLWQCLSSAIVKEAGKPWLNCTYCAGSL